MVGFPGGSVVKNLPASAGDTITKIMASGPTTSWEIDGKQCKQCQTFFFWAPKSLQMVTAAMKLKDAYSLEGKL